MSYKIDDFEVLESLTKAYLSDVRLVIDKQGVKHILKKTPGYKYSDTHHEKIFYEYAKSINVPTLEIRQPIGSDKDQFLLNYLENSTNLSNNPKPEYFFKLGKNLAKLHYQKFDFAYKYIDGHKIILPWNEFIHQTKSYLNTKLSRFGIEKINKYFEILEDCKDITISPSFIHGDLHIDNVLIHNNEAYIFDPSPIFIVGDYRYDICRLLLNLPNAFESNSDDKLMWDAFCNGYGLENDYFDLEFKKMLIFVTIENMANPFLPYLDMFLNEILLKEVEKTIF